MRQKLKDALEKLRPKLAETFGETEAERLIAEQMLMYDQGRIEVIDINEEGCIEGRMLH